MPLLICRLSSAFACFLLAISAYPVAAAAQDPAPASVAIQDYSFTPSTITVAPGTEVTWENDGPSTHSATAGDGSFNTGLMKTGESYSETFNQVGSFDYVCTLHSSMTGVVVVRSIGSSLEDGGTSKDPRGQQPVDREKDSDKRSDHPNTGSEVGLVLLIGLGLVLVGGNGRRMIRPVTR